MRLIFLLPAVPLLLLASGCGAPGPAAQGSLGSIVLRDHVVVVEQSPDGVRYSIETRGGDRIADRLTREQLRAIAPDAARHLEQGTASSPARIAD